jgi:muramidase (phage lysozyme)
LASFRSTHLALVALQLSAASLVASPVRAESAAALIEPLRLSSPTALQLASGPSQPLLPEGSPRSRLAVLQASDGPNAVERFFRFALTPERRALLNTIRYAEGTWSRGQDHGYRIMFGGSMMPSLERHPNRVNYSGGYASAAAGAYQFMPFTWALASRALQLVGFGPDVQDQAALFLIQRRGALALADQGEFSPALAAKLAPEWASFPTLAGRSYYGQPVQRYTVLRTFYERNLSELRASAGQVQPIAQEYACEPADSLRCRLQRLDRVGPRSVAQGS